MTAVESGSRPPWWKGSRGEWFVVAQGALFLLVLFGPRHWPGLVTVTAGVALAATVAGIVLLAGGAALALAALLNLGRNLTPLPYPKADGQFVERGAYRLVRHPIYAGGIAAAFGWALLVHGILTLGYAAVLLIFFDVKSRREERWLRAKYPEYESYRKRVRKLIPFVY
jgi:protein-S-isoprenylcysteine O-methyltransferase Ste14